MYVVEYGFVMMGHFKYVVEGMNYEKESKHRVHIFNLGWISCLERILCQSSRGTKLNK